MPAAWSAAERNIRRVRSMPTTSVGPAGLWCSAARMRRSATVSAATKVTEPHAGRTFAIKAVDKEGLERRLCAEDERPRQASLIMSQGAVSVEVQS